ncbi:HAD family phosphatase [Coprobacillus sp. AF33-1AC]|nr:HAD family phosphatase [Coprobacillus sp. AF33-1AC]
MDLQNYVLIVLGKNNMDKIIFFDIDGTLAVRGEIPESNLKALKLLKDKSHKTFICTGRAPFYAKKLFGHLVDGIVCCNGRYILYQNKKLHGEAFSRDELRTYLDLLDKNNLGALLVSDDCSMAYHLSDEEIEQAKKEYGKTRIQPYDDKITVYTLDIYYRDRERYLNMVNVFKENLVINDHSGIGNCDCSTIGFDKGDGIAYILKYFKISKNDAYAFGDGENDRAMFREVNHGIAMGNAVDSLKNVATYITDNVDQEGITKALKHEKLI